MFMIFEIYHIFLYFAFLFINTKGIEETTRSKLNDFITISKNQEIEIKTNVESKAYFNSIDNNCIIKIEDEFGTKRRIDDQFFTIEPDKKYNITITLYSPDSPSIFNRYLFPLDLSKENIYIENNNLNYLYLIKKNNFTLNFEKNNIKKIIKLSRKTFDSEIIIYKEEQKYKLNKNNLYFEIQSGFKGQLILETNKYDAFIEFLSSSGDDDEHILLMARTSFNNYKIEFNKSTLFIPYTQKEIKIQIFSTKQFQYSLANGFSSGSLYSFYYYNSTSNIKNDANKKNDKYIVSINFYKIYNNITLNDKEYFSFTIDVNLKKNKNIYINYNQVSNIDELMDEEISSIFCNNVIKNLQELFDIYVFSDIAKNPPPINGNPNYHHERINIKQSLSQVSTTERYFYEFYQDIEKIINSVRDRHLNIIAEKSPKGVKISQYHATLPFNFKIKKYKSDYKIYIEKNNYFDYLNDKSTKNFINKHLNLYIKTINRMEPFDYIQNWSIYRRLKNKHSQFTKRISEVSHFYLYAHPLNYSDLSINEYVFEDDQILRIPYYFETIKLNDLKFDNYFLNVIKRTQPYDEIPPIKTIYNNYLIFNGQKKPKLNGELNSTIDWNTELSHTENLNTIKCRVDKINKVNVIYQNSFHFNEILIVLSKILKCVDLFYTNDYPIIIIESENGGGSALIYSTLLQSIQPKIEFKEYFSYRITPITEEYLKSKNLKYFVDTSDCREINSYEDIKHFYYDKYGSDSTHNRTSPFDVIRKPFRLALKEFRKKLLTRGKFLKKPTDIIIFTDSYSYSATSGFIKGLQNTGSAVTVGYFGNPEIKGTDNFDASQAISVVETLDNTRIKNELNKLRFIINGVTSMESYNFHQINVSNQIPREYAFDPVDFRINLYSTYSDDLYDTFIKSGLDIHKQLNKENKCNSKNDKLFLDDSEKCLIIGDDEYAHGGYKCFPNNTWDKNKCEPYYCDIGYYFDQIKKKCMENCKFDNEKALFIYEDNYEKIFDEKSDINYTFIFLYYPERNYFINTISTSQSKKKPINNQIIIFEKKSNINLEIKEIQTKLKLLNFRGNSKYSFFKTGKLLIFLESSEDYILYSDNLIKNSKNQIKIAEENSEMTYDDIININDTYFSEYKDRIHKFNKDTIFILYININEYENFNLFMNNIYKTNYIPIEEFKTSILYLELFGTYTLDFSKNKINRLLKLSRSTLNAEVIIKSKNVVLNSKNLYYQLDHEFKGQLELYVSSGQNAIIEFLFKQDESQLETLGFEKKLYSLNKKYYILPIPKVYKSEDIYITITRNDHLTNFGIFFGYTIPPYNFFSSDSRVNIFKFTGKYSLKISDHYKGDISTQKNEFYCLMMENLGEDVTLEIKDNKSSQSKRLEGWKFSLFVIIFILAL